MTTNFRRTFGDAASPLPLSYLDENFNQLENTSTSTVTLAGAGLVGYIASGTAPTFGWATRTAATKMGDVYSIKDFNNSSGSAVTGDGTTDDSTGIQSAFTWIAANNKTLVFPAGTYAVGSTGWTGIAVVSQSDFAVRMMDGATFKVLVAPSQTVMSTAVVIRMTSCTRGKLKGLKFNGNSINCGLIGLDTCTECVVEKSTISAYGSTANAAIVSVGGTRNVFHRNRITGLGTPTGQTQSRGMWIGNTNSGEIENQPQITNNIVYDTQYTGIVTLCTGGVVSGNTVDSAGGSGIIASTATNGVGQFTVIANNVVRNCTTQGIQADTANSQPAVALNITGNVVEGCGNAGIYLPGLINSTVANNVIRNNGTSSGSGIQLDIASGIACRDVVISGNLIYDDTGNGTRQANGILMQTSNTANAIRDITIIGNQCRGHLANGITLTIAATGTSNHVSIIGNTCRDNATRGIDISGASSHSNITLAFNTCHDNTTEDIRCQPSSGNIYAENNLYGSATLPYVGSATWNPGDLANGAGETSSDVTVTGAALGDFVEASFSLDLSGLTLTGYVKSSNTCVARLANTTGGNVNLGSGTLRLRVKKA